MFLLLIKPLTREIIRATMEGCVGGLVGGFVGGWVVVVGHSTTDLGGCRDSVGVVRKLLTGAWLAKLRSKHYGCGQ